MHKDLSGNHILWAYQALRRIQLFYAIPASDMSAGRINEKIIGDGMDGKYYISRIQSIMMCIIFH